MRTDTVTKAIPFCNNPSPLDAKYTLHICKYVMGGIFKST